ncbi:NirD/YgiW/YdeI family stress tolerance protein [Zophobihabitans entericus]|uniref:YgiW/YdeI family stress tolerance OB fold protein n=1 Tax=Zophobihabitans entericus TaxID=1635327 RepID=A0A6G9I9Q9_9GAMM|nr:NirD/YgiW/YdeI family stress tolerance protein [Zophobihabitans entericus]QIQ20562.1 YgiW/YdeI family stress tolerance OB fold protein [Zophobihabitans entericus]
MKTKLTLLTAAILLASTSAFANYTGGSQGGFNGPSAGSVTVAEAKQRGDDAKVILQGNIISAQGGEYYTFKDSSGEITVEIDHDVWRGITVNPEDTVEIYGEIDKDWTSIKIDVDRIIKVTN